MYFFYNSEYPLISLPRCSTLRARAGPNISTCVKLYSTRYVDCAVITFSHWWEQRATPSYSVALVLYGDVQLSIRTVEMSPAPKVG